MRRPMLLFLVACAAALTIIAGCADLKENLPTPASAESKVHPAGWNDPASAAGFHGAYLQRQAYDPTSCAGCHGGTFTGGGSGVTCFTCHPSVPHSVKFASTLGGHQSYLAAQGFHLEECQTCHGTGYTGGPRVQVSCSGAQCHATAAGAPKSPEACNTCHGQFNGAANDTLSWAPPRALNGETQTSARGVGAHQLHLRGNGVTSTADVACAGCHDVPATLHATGHLTGGRATVAITEPLALTTVGGRTPHPVYDPTTTSCANTYCHGAWTMRRATPLFTFTNMYTDSVMTGSFATPSWTGGSAAAACGSCHGLPPRGHAEVSLSQCGQCHLGIVNSAGQIIDKVRHINGKANVFNQELPFR